MVESALVFLAKILFLLLFSSVILGSLLLFGAIVVCAIGGCTCEACRAITRRFARSDR